MKQGKVTYDGNVANITHEQGVALFSVLAERTRQNQKWGVQNHTPEVWLAILTEEVGELAECILHKKFGGPEAGNLRKELIQVTAVALQMLESGLGHTNSTFCTSTTEEE